MSRLSELQLSMYLAGALSDEEVLQVEAALEASEEDRARFDELKAESQALEQAFAVEQTGEIPIPKFSRPASFREFALANVATGVVIWAAQFLWKTVFGELTMNALTHVTSVYLPDVYDVITETLLYLLNEGTAMLDAYLEFIVLILLTVIVGSLVWYYRNARRATTYGITLLVAGVLLAPQSAEALEIRRDEGVVTIAAGEVIDDTLVVAADTIRIEGTVNGSVVAAGRKIDITGVVSGSVLSFGESVEISGQVGGAAIGGANSFRLEGASIGGDVLGMGEKVFIDDGSTVGGNVVGMGNSMTIEGTVTKDMYAFAEVVEISGRIGEDLEAYTNRVRLLGEGTIAGNAKLRTTEERFHKDSAASVGGEIEFLAMPETMESRSPYASFDFYLWQVVKLISGLLVGLVLFWLIPSLRPVSVEGGVDGLKTAGMGFLFMVSVPVVAVIIAITLIGLPFALIGAAFWLLLIYLAKIVVGGIVGRMVTGNEPNQALTLLAGLAIVIVAVNIPFIGGVINFLLTIVGIGLLVQFCIDSISNRSTEPEAA